MSVDPTGGINISASTAMTEPAIRRPGRGRHPQRTATSPAPPTSTAPHRVTETNVGEGSAVANQGGQGAAEPNAGTAAEGPRAPIAAIAATLAPIAVVAAQPIRRATWQHRRPRQAPGESGPALSGAGGSRCCPRSRPATSLNRLSRSTLSGLAGGGPGLRDPVAGL